MKKTVLFVTAMLTSTIHAAFYECLLSSSDTSYAYKVNVSSYYALDRGKRFNTIIISYGDKEYDSGQCFYGTGEHRGGLERFKSPHLRGAVAMFDTVSGNASKLILNYPGERSVYNCSVLK